MIKRLIDLPSPNHGPRAADKPLDMLILHYTGMRTAEEALERLCDPAAKVSAHYVIDEDGTVYRLVREDRRAWHAGVAYWRGERDINSRSIGIELVNPGHEFGYRVFPDAQMSALAELAADLVSHYRIPPLHVLGHSDVAPTRKEDPGELFDWEWLAKNGVGAWPLSATADDGPMTETELRRLLSVIGYEVPDDVAWDGMGRTALLAFQRHWRPECLTGEPDRETVRRLRTLVRSQCGALGSQAIGALRPI